MNNWQRILDLIRKTGDRFIFEDDQGNGFVVLNANDYENLVLKNSTVKDLSEEELLNKINKDIAIWQATTEAERLPQNWDELKEKVENIEEDHYYFEPIEDED
jgi:hypothetical protein